MQPYQLILTSLLSSLSLVTSLGYSQDEVDDHSRQQRNRQDTGSEPIVKPTLSSLSNTLGPPMERHQRIDHGRHCDNGKETGGYPAHAVAEVEETDSETAEDHGEVEPREKGSFVGEEDFGLDARGESYTLACEEDGSVKDEVPEEKVEKPGADWRSGCDDILEGAMGQLVVAGKGLLEGYSTLMDLESAKLAIIEAFSVDVEGNVASVRVKKFTAMILYNAKKSSEQVNGEVPNFDRAEWILPHFERDRPAHVRFPLIGLDGRSPRFLENHGGINKLIAHLLTVWGLRVNV